jgi:hypothetical protein
MIIAVSFAGAKGLKKDAGARLAPHEGFSGTGRVGPFQPQECYCALGFHFVQRL